MGGILFFWLVFAVLVGVLASSRGRSGFGFFLLSAVFSPLLGLIVVLVMPDLKEQARRASEEAEKQIRDEAQRKRDHERELEALRAVAQQAKAPPDGQAIRESSGTIAAEIEKLAALFERGLLSKEEFETAKARLLSS